MRRSFMLLEAFEKIPSPALLIDKLGKIEAFSAAFTQWSNCDLKVGENIADQLSEDLYLCLQEPILRASRGEYSELTVTLCDEKSPRARVCVNPTSNGCVILAKIPLENMLSHRDQYKLQDLLRVTFDAIDQGISIYDEQLRLVTWNSKFETMGINPDGPIREGANLKDHYLELAHKGVLGPGDPKILAQEYVDIILTRKMKLQEDLNGSDGRVIQINRYYLSGGGLCAVFTDVTEQRKSQAELVQQANHDFLTGCLNRQFVAKALDLLLADLKSKVEPQLSFFFIDLDRFKFVNDTFGHAIGDQLLQQCAKRLGFLVNEGDYLARLGGDEFLIVVRNNEQNFCVTQYAQQLLEAVSRVYEIDNNRIHMSSSIGVSRYPLDRGDAVELIAKADIAMYQSKLKGRNTYHLYSDELGEKIKRRTLVANQLTEDVANQRGFYLHYQPILKLATNSLVSFEALLRWNNAQLGQVSPQEFIPVAEDTGDIMMLGEFVIEQACQFLAQISQHNSEVMMGINVSSLQLLNPGFHQVLAHYIQRYAVNAKLLVIEVTESAIIDDLSEVYDNLVQIRALGCGLAIDDFGTGYSSLSYIRKYPFSHIKIDGCFIKDLQSNPQNASLVKAVIDIASAFELKVVAEGIETLQENRFLKEIGCTYAQGYFHSRPVSEAKALELVTNYTHHSVPQ
ncbi:MAG: diguanylate cyclase (GGDEF)-like protein [Oceanospirillaceae bacterium]|jgi:diguanylate cyclase (GGDEF)-like protein